MLHRRVLLAALHAAVHQRDDVAEALPKVGVARFRVGEVADLRLLDQRADPEDLGAGAKRAADRGNDLLDAPDRKRAGVDRLAARRLLGQAGRLHVAERGQQQRARNRRRRHDQRVDAAPLGGERQALVHAEAVLLVDHRQHQVLEFHVLLEQRVGADDDRDRAVREAREHRLAGRALVAAGQDGDAQPGRLGERLDGREMLARQDLGRRHQRRLAAAFDRLQHGEQRDHRLAAADIALQQAQHAPAVRHVLVDLAERLVLRAGQAEGQRRRHLVLQPAVAA